MILKDLLAIAGSPGLYKFIAQGKNAVIVEHLETGKRTSAHAAAKVSSLEDIAIFTETGEVALSDVFDIIFEKEEGEKSIDHKSSPAELKEYFEEILPEYDRDRVYVSDMKKMIQWYNILHSLDLLKKEEKKDEAEDEAEDEDEAKAEAKAEDKDKDKDKDKAGQKTKD